MELPLDSKIIWEDFKENYTDPERIEEDYEDIDDEDDDIGSDMSQRPNMGGMTATIFSSMGMSVPSNTVYTPWGPFLSNDKFSPIEFYSLKIMHFYKFNVYSIPKLESILDNIDGVAIWKCQDPYCVIIGKAKAYNWREVCSNVEVAILGKVQTKQAENPNLYIAEEIIKAREDLGDFNYIAAVLPNGEIVTSDPIIDPEDYNKITEEILDLKNKLSGIIIIKNGEILCK